MTTLYLRVLYISIQVLTFMERVLMDSNILMTNDHWDNLLMVQRVVPNCFIHSMWHLAPSCPSCLSVSQPTKKKMNANVEDTLVSGTTSFIIFQHLSSDKKMSSIVQMYLHLKKLSSRFSLLFCPHFYSTCHTHKQPFKAPFILFDNTDTI